MTHTEHEDDPWTRVIPDHPARTDSPEYVASRKQMVQLARRAATVAEFYRLGGGTQDHHGGGLWLFHGDDPINGEPFLVGNLCGIEWSAQYGADPAKVDLLRQNAAKLYANYSQSAIALGLDAILDTPITDAAGVARYVDSLLNASVPLPAGTHTGVLSGSHPAAGIHHYPWPVACIPLFAYADLQVFVPDPSGKGMVAVVPVAPRGSGDGRVEVVHATAETPLAATLADAHAAGERVILPADHPLALTLFARQT